MNSLTVTRASFSVLFGLNLNPGKLCEHFQVHPDSHVEWQDVGKWKAFTDGETNVSFNYPECYSLTFASDDSASSMRVYLLKRTLVDTLTSAHDTLYTYRDIELRISLSTLTFDEAATSEGFVKEHGQWFCSSGEDDVPAVSIGGENWTGLKYYSYTSIYGNRGYFGQGDLLVCLAMMQNDSSRSAFFTFYSDGANDEDVFSAIVSSFRFL
jgi:hypothetical protein